MVIKYGIVQGRLTPQKGDFIQCFPEEWREEFRIAHDLGVSHIEWIEGAPNEDPTKPSQTRLTEVIGPLEVPISAVCMDWMVSTDHIHRHGLLADEIELMLTLEEMRDRLGIRRAVLPLLENASLNACKQLDSAHYSTVINIIRGFAREFPEMTLSIETDLDADDVVDLIKKIDAETVTITFDTGNLTRLGYDLGRHIDAYGSVIDNVHIKDCRVGGPSVQLGTGDTDLRVVKRLVELPRVEHLTFQTARAPGSEVDTFRHNVLTIEKILCS